MQKTILFSASCILFFPIYSLLMLALSSDKSGILGAFNNILRMICRIYQKNELTLHSKYKQYKIKVHTRWNRNY